MLLYALCGMPPRLVGWLLYVCMWIVATVVALVVAVYDFCLILMVQREQVYNSRIPWLSATVCVYWDYIL